MDFDLLSSLLKEHSKEIASSRKRELIKIPYTKIGRIQGGRCVHIKGVVIYTSGLESWENCDGSGHKFFFDVADKTDTIRIFAWHDAADEAAKLIKQGQTIGLINLTVGRRRAQFNNLNHKYELTYDEDLSQVIQLKQGSIQAIEEKPDFVPFEEIAEFGPNEYFNVSGKIIRIDPPLLDGISMERGTRYDRRFIYIEDDEGIQLKVVSWNEYIPVSKNSKTLSIIGGKWIREWQNVNSSGAQIYINGVRVK